MISKIRHAVPAIACAMLLFAFPAGSAAGEDLGKLVAALNVAETPEEVSAAVGAILESGIGIAELAAALANGPAYPADAQRGWAVDKVEASDGRQRPFHLYVPDAYRYAKKWPLLVDMHGGVSRPQLISRQQFEQFRAQMWFEGAEKGDFLLAMPMGQAGAEWWTKVGASNVLRMILKIRRMYNVDENRVFVTGFSDGGSGSFFFGANYTTPFAGMIPLNGFLPVAGAGGLDVWIPNLSNKPLYVVNTGRDTLYPAAQVRPYIETLKSAGVIVTYREYEEYGHMPGYWQVERDSVFAFVEETRRNPFPEKLTWECSDPDLGRCHWISIDEIGECGDDDDSLKADFNPTFTPTRVMLGIRLDQAWTGTGVRVEQVVEGKTTASAMGMKDGDVIVGLDDAEVATLADLRAVLDAKKPGDSVKAKVKRGEDEIDLEGRFEAAEPRPYFAREAKSGRISASRKGNSIEVRARGVRRFTVFASAGMLDVGKPVIVVVNGRKRFEGLVKADIGLMLRMYASERDRTMIFCGSIAVLLGEEGEGF